MRDKVDHGKYKDNLDRFLGYLDKLDHDLNALLDDYMHENVSHETSDWLKLLFTI